MDGFRCGMLMLYLESFGTLKAEKLLYRVLKCTIRDHNGPQGSRHSHGIHFVEPGSDICIALNWYSWEKEKRKPSVSASWDPLGFLQIPKTLLVEQLISSGHQKGSPCFRKPKVLVEYRISVRNQVGIQRDHLCVCMMPKARVWVFPINLEDRTKEIKGLHKLVQSNG